MPGWLKKGTERITSAKWWNRKSQPTFSQWNTDLTIIYGQKYLYEPSKFHLASWGMPGEHRVKNSHIWTGNKNNFTLPTSLNIFIHFYPSSKPEQISARRECPGLWHSSSGGGKRTVMYSMLQLFRGLPKRPVSTSLHLEALKELELCRCLGTAEKKEEWWVACCGWHGSAWSGKNTNLEDHRRKRKEWRMYPASQLFKGLTEGMISVLAQDDDKEQAWIPGGHGEQGRAGKLVAKEQENINAAGRHQREWDYELLKNNPSASN